MTVRKILYSPGFGAGWSTWESDAKGDFMATYQPIIEYIEGGGTFEQSAGDIYELAVGGGLTFKPDAHPLLVRMVRDMERAGLAKTDHEGVPYVCCLGARDLRVALVNGRYRVSEYDGNERIVEESQEVWK